MTETDTFSSKPTEEFKASLPPEKKSFAPSSAGNTLEGLKPSTASYLKAPSEPEDAPPPEIKKPESAEAPKEKTEEELKAEQLEKERLRLEEEQAKAKEKAESEARRELTAAQIQAKTPKTEKEMFEELEMLTATKNLTPSQIGMVLQWLIKQEILQSERIKHLQKEVAALSKEGKPVEASS